MFLTGTEKAKKKFKEKGVENKSNALFPSKKKI